MSKKFLYAVLIVAALAFALLVWPTPYKYVEAENGRLHSTLKINRITGRSWMLQNGAWYRIFEPSDLRQPLPTSALKKITADCQGESEGTLTIIEQCVFENDSSWVISSLTAEVLPIDSATGQPITKDPPATVQFSGTIGFRSSATLKPDQPPAFSIKHATDNVRDQALDATYQRFRVHIVSAVGEQTAWGEVNPAPDGA